MGKSMVSFAFFMALAAVCAVPRAGAQESSYSFGFGIVKAPNGSLVLKVNTNMAASGMWLGVTIYPPKSKTPAANAESQIFPVKSGNGIIEIPVAPHLKDGTFEAALYAKKLTKAECLATDEVCQKAGFKLVSSMSYLWGYLTAP